MYVGCITLAYVSCERRAGFSPPSAFSLTKLQQIKTLSSFKASGPHVPSWTSAHRWWICLGWDKHLYV